jgi:hypothetical protein
LPKNEIDWLVLKDEWDWGLRRFLAKFRPPAQANGTSGFFTLNDSALVVSEVVTNSVSTLA